MIPRKDQFGQRLEDEIPDRVEEEQAQVTDKVDWFPELQGGVHVQEPEGHSEVGEPLQSDEPADPVVDSDAAVPLVCNKFPAQNFVEEIFDRLWKKQSLLMIHLFNVMEYYGSSKTFVLWIRITSL